MQDSNQINNIFRQIQNGYIKRSSSKESPDIVSASGKDKTPQPPDIDHPDEWEEYTHELYKVLFMKMLEAVSIADFDQIMSCKETGILDFDKIFIHNPALDKDEAVEFIVAEEDALMHRMCEPDFQKIVRNLYSAHLRMHSGYEDEAFGLEEGGSIE